jgi:predicted ATPase
MLAPTEALIGRGRELELLGGVVREVTGGAARTVLVEGEAGIGKTRLLRSAIAVARESGVAVFQGEAHPLERTRPFGALVEALELRSRSSDPRRAAIGRLLAGEGTVAPDSPPAGALQFRVVEEIIDLIETLSDQGPVLVALEERHWADSSTLLAFRWMTRQLTQVPLLLVATLRPSPRSPELSQLLEDSVESGANIIRLEALGRSDVAALVQAELGLPPGPNLAGLVGRAAGNPLWVVELVRSMSAEGTVDLTGVSAEVSGADLPDSLRQLILRRLSYLPGAAAAVLRSASLLGDGFSLVDLATVTDRRARDLLEELRPALASGLLADQGRVLVFRHQLVRDAIYEDIPEAARVALHREAGRALTAAGAPLSQVASHVLLGAVVGDAAAALSLRAAAREAAARAPGIAVDLLRRAQELLPPGHPERDRVLQELVVALLRTGEVSQAAAIAEEVLGRPHTADVEMPLRILLIDSLSLLNRGAELIEQTEAALTEKPDMGLADQALIVAQGSYGRTFSGDFVGGELVARRGSALPSEPAMRP